MALVTLLAHTPQPELHVAAAAKLCYSPSSIDKIKEGLTEEKVASLIFGDKSVLFDMDSAKNIYLKGTDFSTRKNLAAATEVNTILTEEFDKAFAGAQSVDKTLANAQKRADEKIADEK